jgi:vesicle coat complex subunit
MVGRHLHKTLFFTVVLCFTSGCGNGAAPVVARGKPVSHWLQELKSPSAKARKQAAFCLGLVGAKDEAAVPALTGAVKDEDAEVRRAAVLALLNIGPPARDAVPALERARNDVDAQVRSYAAKAIQRIFPSRQ